MNSHYKSSLPLGFLVQMPQGLLPRASAWLQDMVRHGAAAVFHAREALDVKTASEHGRTMQMNLQRTKEAET